MGRKVQICKVKPVLLLLLHHCTGLQQNFYCVSDVWQLSSVSSGSKCAAPPLQCCVLLWQRNLKIASCCYILPYTASDHNWCMMMQINCCLRLATLLKQNLFHLCIESQTEREGITIRSQVLEPWAYLFLFVRGSDSKYFPDFCIFLLGFSHLVLVHFCPLFQINMPMSRAVGEGDGGYSLQISDRK